MPDTIADRGPITDVAIDAHYYDAGLKVARLAGGTVQPSWVPAGAPDLVGLHEAFSIQPGDRAVEISRLCSGPHAVTWIAVYRRSQDASYGDRGNYAGVGVWLLNQVVHGPEFVLDGLDTLSRTLVEGGLAAAQGVAERFIAPVNLPGKLAPLSAMPPGLTGWAFSQDLLPVKELYEVTVANGDRVAWQPVAEHILRMMLLPAPSAAHARSLILVRPAANAGAGPSIGFKPLPTGLAADLAKALPEAMMDQQLGHAALTRDHQGATQQRDRLQQELAAAHAVQANQALRVADLERQLDASDLDGRFKAMGGTLARVDEQARGNGLALEQIADAIRRIELGVGKGATSTNDRDRSSVSSPFVAKQYPAQSGGPTKFHDGGTISDRNSDPWIFGSLAVLFVIMLSALIYWSIQRDFDPRIRDGVATTTVRDEQPALGTDIDNQLLDKDRDQQNYLTGDRRRYGYDGRSGAATP